MAEGPVVSTRSMLGNLRRWLQGILTVPEIPLATGESRRRTPEVPRSHLGARAEEAALRHLSARGLRLLCRNRVNLCGELDLVMEQGETVVIVEVRARTAGSAVSSHDAVGPQKLAKVRRTAELFLRQHRLEKRAVRLDVVAVEMSSEGAVTSLEHFEAVA